MFREMRRAEQLLSFAETVAILERCTSGVLACLGEHGYPYAVPLSYVYFRGKIYLHSAQDGHKIDAITAEPKVSFAVVGKDTPARDMFTTHYRSVIAFGEARIVRGDERLQALQALAEKYARDLSVQSKRQAVAECNRAQVIGITITHITGKEASAFAKAKTQLCGGVRLEPGAGGGQKDPD